MKVLDIETYSPSPIKYGVHRYAEQAETLLIAWGGLDGPVQVWDVTCDPMPDAFRADILDSGEPLIAHNAAFERTLLAHTMPHLNIAPDRWRCSMARAYAHGLPGSLGQLAGIMNLPTDKQKDRIGMQLIRLFCCPQPANRKVRRETRETRPVEWAQFIEYCRQDVTTTAELWKQLPGWNYPDNLTELGAWQLDQRIGQRGVAVDLALVDGAMAAIDAEQKRLGRRTGTLTDNALSSTMQRDRLLRYLVASYGVELPDMTSATLTRRVEDPDLPEAVRELLKIRLQASRSSTSKYQAIRHAVSSDGRARGLIQYCGAQRTGRASGRIINPLNFLRPTMPQDDIETGIDALKTGCADLLFADVMDVAANTMRGVIVAPPGRKLVIADLSNIEGRVVAWLAGEAWKLQAFRDFDAGKGHDLYKLSYARAFRVRPEDVTKEQRQIGKVMELALGYGGGVAAFVTFATTYGIDLDELADAAASTIPQDVYREAENFYAWTRDQKRETYGLSERVFVVCDALKRMWRRAHPAIKAFWRDTEDAVRSAVLNPGTTFQCQRIAVRRDRNWLRLRLPGGRFLCYPSPRIDDGGVTYLGVNQYSRKWARIRTYSGKLVENLTQATARDVFYHAAPLIERARYAIVLHVYDEYITEAPDTDDYTARGLSDLMTTVPAWADGLPLSADGFEAARYRKG
ncbi:MAG: DNA polymerase [Burkholderia gladioli]